MGADQRWGFLPFIVLRSLQLLMAIIAMGLAADITAAVVDPNWQLPFGLFASIISVIWCIVAIALFFTNHLLPLAVVIIDAFILVFWLIAMAGMGSATLYDTNLLTYNCSACETDEFGEIFCLLPSVKTICELIKATFAFELLSMITFLFTLVLAAITLHRTRSDLSGRKYAQGDEAYPETEVVQQVPMHPVGVEDQQGAYYTQQTQHA